MAGRLTRRPLVGPFLFIAVPISVAVYTIVIYSVEAPRSAYLSRLWATLAAFSGSSVALDGQDANHPSRKLTIAFALCLLVTLAAAVSAGFALTGQIRNHLRAMGAGEQLVVIGSGVNAAQVLRSRAIDLPVGTPQRNAVLLITAEPDGPAATIAAARRVPTVVMDLIDFAQNDDLKQRTYRAAHVAVATDEDALNRSIAEFICRPGDRADKVMALISNPQLADELRPAVIEGELTERYCITSSVENIAEALCHTVDALLLTNPTMMEAGRVDVFVDGDGGMTTQTVRLWLDRLAWSRSYLSDQAEFRLPTLELVSHESSRRSIPLLRIVVGEDAAETAARALRGRRLRATTEDCAQILVASQKLVGVGDPSSNLIVMDPAETAWKHDLLFDDIERQWGRSYHYSYGIIFAHGEAVEPWEAVRDGKDGQSSIKAAQHMLKILDENGFRLVKTNRFAARFEPCQCMVDAMARAEHEDWLNREYEGEDKKDHRVVLPGNKYAKPWEELTAELKLPNRRLIAQTFPALAALFGYEIQPNPARPPYLCQCGGRPGLPAGVGTS